MAKGQSGTSDPSDPQHHDPSTGGTASPDLEQEPTGGKSRRTFLKAAVVASAAVAVTGAAAGTALIVKKPSQLFIFSTNEGSGQDPCTGCVTGTQSDCGSAFPQLGCLQGPCPPPHPQFKIQKNGGAADPGDFNLWVTVKGVPANELVSIALTLDPNFTPKGAMPYYLYTYPANTGPCPTQTAAYDCNGGDPAGATFIRQGASLASLGFPYHVGGTSLDVQLRIHMDYTGGALSGGAGTTKDFTFTFTVQEGIVGQPLHDVCTDDTVTITGVQQKD